MGSGWDGRSVSRGGRDRGDRGVSELGENVTTWYKLLKEFLSDVRGIDFKNQKKRLKIYEDLFGVLRQIHVDYVDMFTNLRDDMSNASEARDIGKIISKFRRRREKLSSLRVLSKHDADAYIKIADDVAEARYLASVLWYFQYLDKEDYIIRNDDHLDYEIFAALSHSGTHGWDSASTSFLIFVKDSEDSEEIISVADKMVTSIGLRFGTVLRAYSELEGNWRYSRKPKSSALSRVLDPLLGRKPQAEIADERLDAELLPQPKRPGE
jgi:hypothetical protein